MLASAVAWKNAEQGEGVRRFPFASLGEWLRTQRLWPAKEAPQLAPLVWQPPAGTRDWLRSLRSVAEGPVSEAKPAHGSPAMMRSAGDGDHPYAPVPDLCSAIAFWSGREPGDPADVRLMVILPPDAELTWRMVRGIVRSEVAAKIGRPAVVWPPPSRPIVVSEVHRERFEIVVVGGGPPNGPSAEAAAKEAGGRMCGLIFHYRVPHAAAGDQRGPEDCPSPCRRESGGR